MLSITEAFSPDRSRRARAAKLAARSIRARVSAVRWRALARFILAFSILLPSAGCGADSGPSADEVTGDALSPLKAASLKSLAVSLPASTLYANSSEALTATGTYSDGSTQDLTTVVSWTSSNTAVAAVAASGLLTTVSNGSATITARLGTVAGKATVRVLVTLTSLAVAPAEVTLPAGATQSLKPKATYSNKSTKTLTSGVTWTSSDSSVATVSNVGLLITVGPGTATLMASTAVASSSPVVAVATVTVDGGTLLSCSVTPTTKKLPADTSQQFKATASFSDGFSQVLAPPVVSWSSSNPALATVNASGMATAVAVGGPLTITATPLAGGATCAATLTVSAARLLSLSVAPPNSMVSVGLSQQFSATGTFADGSTADLTNQVTWTASAPTIASISVTGNATTETVGTTTIFATDPKTKKAASATLGVTPASLESVALFPPAPTLRAGTSVQIDAVGTFSDGTPQDLTSIVDWSSSNPAVASVTLGLVSGLSPGTTTIAAVDPNTSLNQSEIVTVTPGQPLSITITPSDPAVSVGSTVQLVATAVYSNGSSGDLTQSVTWASGSAAVAVANAPGSAGLVMALTVGEAVVSATDPGSGVSAQTTVTALAPTLQFIVVLPPNPYVALGYTEQFLALGGYSDGSNADLTKAVTWSLSFPNVASISNAPETAGLLTPLAEGYTLVVATDPTTGISANTLLGVTPPTLLGVAITPATATIPNGLAQQFSAIGTFSDGSTSDVTTGTSWVVSSGTATISNRSGSVGLATSAGAGESTITAQHVTSGFRASATLEVTSAHLVSIGLTPTSPTVAVDAKLQLSASGAYDDGTAYDMTNYVTWSSDNAASAAVSNAADSRGLMTGVGPGSATITALEPTTGIFGSASAASVPPVVSCTPPAVTEDVLLAEAQQCVFNIPIQTTDNDTFTIAEATLDQCVNAVFGCSSAMPTVPSDLASSATPQSTTATPSERAAARSRSAQQDFATPSCSNDSETAYTNCVKNASDPLSNAASNCLGSGLAGCILTGCAGAYVGAVAGYAICLKQAAQTAYDALAKCRQQDPCRSLDLTCCAGKCVDTQSDDNNCGGCGGTCEQFLACADPGLYLTQILGCTDGACDVETIWCPQGCVINADSCN